MNFGKKTSCLAKVYLSNNAWLTTRSHKNYWLPYLEVFRFRSFSLSIVRKTIENLSNISLDFWRSYCQRMMKFIFVPATGRLGLWNIFLQKLEKKDLRSCKIIHVVIEENERCLIDVGPAVDALMDDRKICCLVHNRCLPLCISFTF